MVRSRRFVVSFALSAAVSLLGLVVACSNANEGERCQIDNGNDDCKDGLVCTRSTDLPLPPNYQGTVPEKEGRCCPQDRSKATAPECAQTPQAPGGDAALPPADSSPPADGASDAGDSGNPDAAGDSGSNDAASDGDAPTDANEAG